MDHEFRHRSELYFKDLKVGDVADIFEHQGTYFGTFHATLEEQPGPFAARIREFILFCRDWFTRSHDGDADTDEFDSFSELVSTGDWRIKNRDGDDSGIVHAPMFNDAIAGNISWRVEVDLAQS